MNALRQEAFRMIEAMPDDGLAALIQYMVEYNRQLEEKRERIAQKKKSLDEILRMAKPLPNLDYEKELAEYREERLGYARVD